MNIDSDPLAPLQTLMTAARKQTLVLMVAVNDGDDELALIAATRVRDAIRSGEHVAVSLQSDVDRRAAIGLIETTRFSAKPWLARAPQRLTGARETAQLLGRFGSGDVPDLPSLDPRSVVSDIELNGVSAADVDISMLHVRGLRGRGANLDRLQATGARLAWCDLYACTLSGSRFDAAMVEDTNFERANLECSSWSSARTNRSNFCGAMLMDARLDNAVFTECDLRGADLSVVNSTLRDAPVATTFLRCDLREVSWHLRDVAGTRFVECNLGGARGVPLGWERSEIQQSELDPDWPRPQ